MEKKKRICLLALKEIGFEARIVPCRNSRAHEELPSLLDVDAAALRPSVARGGDREYGRVGAAIDDGEQCVGTQGGREAGAAGPSQPAVQSHCAWR